MSLIYRRIGLVTLSLLVLACGGEEGAASGGAVGAGRVLTRVAPADPAECARGGSIVFSGVDGDGDGTLDDAEIADRNVLCQAAPDDEPPPPAPPQPPTNRPTPRPTLTRVVEVPPGATCTLGGSIVLAGADDDGDGLLDDGEVERSTPFCTPGLLTSMRAEPAGEHCLGGGMAVLLGRDDDGDGALDDGEIESTEYECSDSLTHDVVLKTAADVALFSQIRHLSGTLLIDSSAGLVDVELPKLEWAAWLTVDGSPLERLAAPQLGGVGYLSIKNNERLHTLDLSNLSRAAGIRFEANADLGGLDMKSLHRVEEQLVVRNNGALPLLELGSLEVARGGIVVDSNPLLAKVNVRLKESVSELTIKGNPALTSAELRGPGYFDGCQGCGVVRVGSLSVRDNASLATASFAAEQFGRVRVDGNGSLGSLVLSFQRVDEYVDVKGASLSDLDLRFYDDSSPFGGPEEERVVVGGYVNVEAPLESTSLTYAEGGFDFGSLRLAGTEAASFYLLCGSIVRGNLTIEANPELEELYLECWGDHDAPEDQLVGGGVRVIGNPELTRFSFRPPYNYTLHGDLTIRNNARLTSLEHFGPIMKISGNLYIENNPLFERPQWGGPGSVGGYVVFGELPALRGLGLHGLTSVGEQLIVRNTGLTGWDDLGGAPHNLARAEAVDVRGNPALQDVHLPALHGLDWLLISENAALRTLRFEALKEVGVTMWIHDNPALPACAVEALFEQVACSGETQEGNDEGGVCP
jgi:hypothetical protein